MKFTVNVDIKDEDLVELDDFGTTIIDEMRKEVEYALRGMIREIVTSDPRVIQAANMCKDKIFEIIFAKEDAQ